MASHLYSLVLQRAKPTPESVAFGSPLRLELGETAPAFTARLQATRYGLAREAEAALAETAP